MTFAGTGRAGAIASKAVKIDPKDLQPSDKAKAAFKVR